MINTWRGSSRFIKWLVFTSIVGLILYGFSALINHDLAFSYLLWNLLLAWIPLLASLHLLTVLGKKLWSSWEAMFWSFIWIIFLPNSFYMISDYIHLQYTTVDNAVYYAVTFTSIIFSAVLMGLFSLYLVHLELQKRFSSYQAGLYIGLVLVTCSVAIYIGRDLRWNSWDILTNPWGLILDFGVHLVSWGSSLALVQTTGLFFILIGSMYLVAWNGLKLFRQ